MLWHDDLSNFLCRAADETKTAFSKIAGGSGFRLHDGPDLKLFILVGWDRSFRLLLGPPGLN